IFDFHRIELAICGGRLIGLEETRIAPQEGETVGPGYADVSSEGELEEHLVVGVQRAAGTTRDDARQFVVAEVAAEDTFEIGRAPDMGDRALVWLFSDAF